MSVTPENLLMELHGAGVCYWQKKGLFTRRPFWAVHDLTFNVMKGETLGIIGHNGAGKSTLLRLLAGIIEPDAGKVIHHTDRISLLALNVGLVKHLSGRENAILGGLMLGLTRREIEGRLAAMIEFSELAEFIDQPVYTYSAGMRARLGFSVALQNDPDVLLIDEVLGVGDKDFKKKSSDVIKQRIDSDHTVILVSHQASTLRKFCDRVVWIEHGQLVMVDDADRVIEQYESNRHDFKREAKARLQQLNATDN